MFKTLLIFALLSLSLSTLSQSVSTLNFKANYRFSFETLKRSTEKDIGLIGLGYDLFPFEKHNNIYFTFNSYSAISGNRAGVFSFGAGAGLRYPFLKNRLSIDAGCFIAGGGGGGAPDGGGLILREHIELFANFKNWSFFTGVSRLDFANGDMGSTNFNLGFIIQNKFYTAKELKDEYSGTQKLTDTKKLRFSGIASVYNKVHKGPVENGHKTYSPNTKIALFGVELDKFISKNLYASVELNGVVRGGVDGYMSYLVGLGYQVPFFNSRFSIDAQVLGGPSGGGGVATGGGGTLKAALALRATVFKNFQLHASYGRMFAPVGKFDVDVIDFGFSRMLNYYQTPNKVGVHNYKVEDEHTVHKLSFEVFNRSYFPPHKRDKNNLYYDEFFNLIGFRFSRIINKRISLLGSTIWAYQGSYGAYGEGWVGAEFNFVARKKWNMNVRAMLGAAGGGGLSLGSGLVAQYGLGVQRRIAENWNLSLNAGRMQGIKGNFTPIYLDLGVKFTIGQLYKKN